VISVTDDYVKKEKFTLQQDMKTQKDSKYITILSSIQALHKVGWYPVPIA
jgi:hypothetical protein